MMKMLMTVANRGWSMKKWAILIVVIRCCGLAGF
jgi:hypothetical protein